MLDTATTALLRAILDEVYESVSARETGARTSHLKSWKRPPAERSRPKASGKSVAKPFPGRRPCGAEGKTRR